MNIDFPFVLVSLVAISGTIALIDGIVFARKRLNGEKIPWIPEQARSLFPVLLLVLVLRSFVGQPFRVPTSSLEPTVMPGDLLAVGMYQYGLRLPVWHTKIFETGEPKRGDIVLFRWPVNPKENFIKRLIGLPGDHISYINKVLFINGQPAKQTFIKDDIDHESNDDWIKRYEENLNGVKHQIFRNPNRPSTNFYDFVVPKRHYFMMGDNRDNSGDSRFWGVVPESAIIGKGIMVWMNWFDGQINWHRIGTFLNQSDHLTQLDKKPHK